MCPELMELPQNNKGYTKKLCCSQEIFDAITIKCVEEFKKHHPELEGVNVTQNMILSQLKNFYLRSR
ncbi:hypothetical protein LCGC14_1065150 [marine sediment metagenome]|uniref:Uncharacterized protein n=1 Tax=marine sediment metagenome TaxID=412755 RepID=A0A0F9QQQ3_9ZZZZ